MSEKIIITFPDGNKKEVDKGINGLELASQISKSLAKESVAIKINNEIKDISLPINADASVSILKRDSEEALELIRHDCAHVMAEAVQELFPGTQVTIGPAIENGFYYDFARDEPFTVADLPKIENSSEKVFSEETAYQMTSILQGAVKRGTAKKLKSLNVPLAGKTGTTNDNYDAWFIGFSSNLVIAITKLDEKPINHAS